ncbi:hypothetical protein ACKWTF_005551 [Chironomus riparius]
MSEFAMTVESLRRHLPFLDKIIAHMRGAPFVKQFENMKNVIDCGKKLSPEQVQKIEAAISNLQKKINDSNSCSSSGSAKKNNKNKSNEMEVICLSSDDETTSNYLPYHKEHEVVEIKTKQQNLTNGTKQIPNNRVQEIVLKPERPDVEIITTIIQTNNITPDTDSQKIALKPERSDVETIIREVKLTTDHNGNSQHDNSYRTDHTAAKIKEEEPESDIDDWKTVYSGSSGQSAIKTFPDSNVTQNHSEDDEILRPASVKRKRRKISSSSEVSDIEKSKDKRKRRRIMQNSESSDDEMKSQKTSSTSSSRSKRNKSNSSSESEFYSAESAKSSEKSVKSKLSNEKLMNSLEGFREAIIVLSTNKQTTETSAIINLVKNSIPDLELTKLIMFLRQCCERGLLSLDKKGLSRNRSNERVLEDFVRLTLNPLNEKDQTSSDESSDSSESESMLDFSDDQDYQCYLNKNDNSLRRSKTAKKLRLKQRRRELDILREDIDKSFIKPSLLTLKPREHKKVDYNIDNKSSTSDDSDAFVNSIPKDKSESPKKKKHRGRRRISDSSSSKGNQNKNNESDESETGFKETLKAKKLEDLDSDRTTPDNLVGKPMEILKNENSEDNRSTPDIDLENDPRVVSFESNKNTLSDEDIDTECSSGETISPKIVLLPSDEDEHENNPVYHFITAEKITGCKVIINKLHIIHKPKPKPYKVHFVNGVWKINNENSTKQPEVSNLETNCQTVDVIKPIIVPVNVETASIDQPKLERPEVVKNIENENVETTTPFLNIKTSNEEKEDKADLKNMQTALDDNLFYDPILSESDEDFIDMKSYEKVLDNNLKTGTKDHDEKQETSMYDPISSESEDDALYIDTQAQTKDTEEENMNKANSNNQSGQDNNQHPVTKIEKVDNHPAQNKTTDTNVEEYITIEDSEEIVQESNIQERESPVGPRMPVTKIEKLDNHPAQNKTTDTNVEEFITIEDSEEIVPENNIQEKASPVKTRMPITPAKNPNSTIKEKLNKNSNTLTNAAKQSSTPNKDTVLQQTPQKNTTQHRVSPNNIKRKCSPMSKLLTANERKVLNLSYISCRGGYQFRCLNNCKYYNLREDAFKYHILSRHVMDKWAGFCNLCGKSFSKEIRPLIDEYDHMIKYHIKPEHEQRLSTKENIDLVDDDKNDDNDSHDSDCVVISQPLESTSDVPKPINDPKKEPEVAPNVQTNQNPSDKPIEQENAQDVGESKSSNHPELTQNEQSYSTDAAIDPNPQSNIQQVLQNIGSTCENAAVKQILRIKSLPGDKLSGRTNESSTSLHPMKVLDPEMTFEQLTELERARKTLKNALISEKQPSVPKSSSNYINPSMTLLPEGCVPQTTSEQEADLQAVIEENISRYDQVQQPFNRRAPIVPPFRQNKPINFRASIAPTMLPNSIILQTTTNALVTYTPSSGSFRGVNAINNIRMAQPLPNQNDQTSPLFMNQQAFVPNTIRRSLPNQSYQVRPTAAIAPSPKNSFNDIESGNPSNALISNSSEAQNSNTYGNTATIRPNYGRLVQRPPIHVPAPETINAIQNQIPSTSQYVVQGNVATMCSIVCKTRSMRPWLDIEDLKAKSVIEKCFDTNYMSKLYKCMLITCSFATDHSNDFRDHLTLHQKAVKNPKNSIFCCSYCTYNTQSVNDLVLHITRKYSQCKFYCSRCFYRTCSQYSAVQHTLIHKNVGTTKIYNIQSIQPTMEDQEFEKINLRELPILRCIGCPQIFHTYYQLKLHLRQCYTNSRVNCNKCNKNDSISNLEQHQTNCYGVYTYNCCYCLFGTQNIDLLSEHVVHVHMEKIPFYIERCDTSHLLTPLLKKAACVKKFAGRT